MACADGSGQKMQRQSVRFLRSLTFELSWHRRWDARPGLAKMYRVPPAGPAWPAVGAQLERGVRPQLSVLAGRGRLCFASDWTLCVLVFAGLMP